MTKLNNSQKEQGVLIDCISCTIIYPEGERPDCPECNGKKKYFLPAQMMDKLSSHKIIMNDLNNLLKLNVDLNFVFFNTQDLSSDNVNLLKDAYFNLLKKVLIYNFDLKDFLIQNIKNLDLIS